MEVAKLLVQAGLDKGSVNKVADEFAASLKNIDKKSSKLKAGVDTDAFQKNMKDIRDAIEKEFKNINLNGILDGIIDAQASSGKIKDWLKETEKVLNTFQVLRDIQGQLGKKGQTLELFNASQLNQLLDFAANKDFSGLSDNIAKAVKAAEEKASEIGNKYYYGSAGEINTIVNKKKILSGEKHIGLKTASVLGIPSDNELLDNADMRVQLADYMKTSEMIRQLIAEKQELGEIKTTEDAEKYLRIMTELSSSFQQLGFFENRFAKSFSFKDEDGNIKSLIDDSKMLSTTLKDEFKDVIDFDSLNKMRNEAEKLYINMAKSVAQNAFDTVRNQLFNKAQEMVAKSVEKTVKKGEKATGEMQRRQSKINGESGSETGTSVGAGTGGTGTGSGSGTGTSDGSGGNGTGQGDINVKPNGANFISDLQSQIDGQYVTVDVKPNAESFVNQIKDKLGEVQFDLNQDSGKSSIPKSNEAIDIFKKWQEQNIENIKALPELGMVFNNTTGQAYEILNNQVAGLSQKLVDNALKNIEFAANSVVHSHPNETTAAFSFDDIQRAIQHKAQDIMYEYVASINDVAALDLSKFTADDLQKISDQMKSKGISTDDTGDADWGVDEYEVFDAIIKDNVNQYVNAVLSQLTNFLKANGIDDTSIQKILDSSRRDIEALPKDALSNFDDYYDNITEILDTHVQNYATKVATEFAEGSSRVSLSEEIIDNSINSSINMAMQQFIENTLKEAIQSIRPDLNLGDVYKKINLDDLIGGKTLFGAAGGEGATEERQMNATVNVTVDAQKVRNDITAALEEPFNITVKTDAESVRSGVNEQLTEPFNATIKATPDGNIRGDINGELQQNPFYVEIQPRTLALTNGINTAISGQHYIDIYSSDTLKESIQSILSSSFKIDINAGDISINSKGGQGGGGYSPSQAIADMVRADAWMQENFSGEGFRKLANGELKAMGPLKERAMFFSTKTGYHTNPMIFNHEHEIASYKILDSLSKEERKKYQIDAQVHSHPEDRAYMSIDNFDGQRYFGDFQNFLRRYINEGISTQVVAAQKDVQIFDVQKFMNDHADMFFDKIGDDYTFNDDKMQDFLDSYSTKRYLYMGSWSDSGLNEQLKSLRDVTEKPQIDFGTIVSNAIENYESVYEALIQAAHLGGDIDADEKMSSMFWKYAENNVDKYSGIDTALGGFIKDTLSEVYGQSYGISSLTGEIFEPQKITNSIINYLAQFAENYFGDTLLDTIKSRKDGGLGEVIRRWASDKAFEDLGISDFDKNYNQYMPIDKFEHFYDTANSSTGFIPNMDFDASQVSSQIQSSIDSGGPYTISVGIEDPAIISENIRNSIEFGEPYYIKTELNPDSLIDLPSQIQSSLENKTFKVNVEINQTPGQKTDDAIPTEEPVKKDVIIDTKVEQPKESLSDEAISSEIGAFDKLKEKLISDIPNAVDVKTQAFRSEQVEVDNLINLEISKIEELANKLQSAFQNIDTPGELKNFFESINNLKFSDKNIANIENLQESITSLVNKIKELNSNGVQEGGIFTSIGDLVSHAEELKNLATILSASEKQIKNAQNATGTGNQKPLSDSEQAINNYKELTQHAMEFFNLQQKIQSGAVLSDTEYAKYQNYKTMFEQADAAAKKYGNTISELTVAQGKYNQRVKEVEANQAKLDKERQEKLINDSIQKTDDRLGRIGAYNKDRWADQYSTLKEAISNANEQFRNTGDVETYTQAVNNAFSSFEQFSKMPAGKPLEQTFGSMDDAKLYFENMVNSYKTVLKGVSGSTTVDSSGLAQWSATVRDAEGNVQKLTASWKSGVNEMVVASQQLPKQLVGLPGIIDGIKSKVGQLAKYWTARLFDPYRMINNFKRVIGVVKEYDSAMMEIRKVSQASAEEFNNIKMSSFDVGKSIGATGKDVLSSVAAWKRLGKSLEESQEAAKASNWLLNVSEFTNIDDATKSLVSMTQAFDGLSYESAIDKLNGVGDAFSSSTDQIAYGMQNVASVLQVAGNDIDQSIALLAAANDITQDMSKASMGVRTVALRIAGTQDAKQQLEDMGEDTSDFVVQTTSKVDQKVRNYTKTAATPNGIGVLDDNGRLRDTYDILLDIAKVWDDIVAKDNEFGTNTSNALLELLAGKTRSNVLASILQAPDILESAYKTSKGSAGVGQRELDIYMDSIQAKTTQLTNSLQELANITINSESFKTLLDIVNALLSGVNSLAKQFGSLNTIIGGIVGITLQRRGMGILPTSKGAGWWSMLFGDTKKSEISNVVKSGLSSAQSEISHFFSSMDFDRNKGFFDQMFEAGFTKEQLYRSDIFGPMLNSMKEAEAEHLKMGAAQDMLNSRMGNTIQIVGRSASSFSKLGSILGNIGSTLLTTAATMGAMFIIEGVIKAIYNYATAQQRAIEAGKEAQKTIEDLSSSYDKTKESISGIKDEYAKLSEGVSIDKNGNAKNINLSDDEFERYLELSNQIADIAPELVTGYDDQGKAIVNLGNTVEGVTQKLDNFLKTERDIANTKIGQNLDTLWKGIKDETSKYSGYLDNEKGILDDYLEDKDVQIKQFDEKNREITQFMVDQNTSEITVGANYQAKLRKKLTELGVERGQTKSADGSTFTYSVDLSGLNTQQIRGLNAFVTGEATDQERQKKYSEAQIKKYQLLVDSTYKKAIPAIQEYVDKTFLFDDVEQEMQEKYRQGFKDVFSKVDYASVSGYIKDAGGLESWVDGMISSMMANEDTQGAFKGLIELVQQRGTMTYQEIVKARNEYYKIISDAFVDTEGNPLYTKEDLDIFFGYATKDSQGNVQYTTKGRISDAIAKMGFDENNAQKFHDEINAVNADYADAALSAIESMPQQKAKNIANNWDAFWNYIKPYITGEKHLDDIKDGMLKDLFEKEDYKSSVEAYEKSLSSLTGALDKIRQNGKLTNEEMADLQELDGMSDYFKSIEDFSEDKIGVKAFEILNDWISKIRENIDDTWSDDSIKAAETYIKNIQAQWGEFGMTVEQANTKIRDILVTSSSESVRSYQEQRANDIINAFAEAGVDQETEAFVHFIADPSNLEGDTKDIIARYQDYVIEWKLNLNTNNAETEFQNMLNKFSADISNQEAINASRAAKGEILTPFDYSGIVYDKQQIANIQSDRAEYYRTRYNSLPSSVSQTYRDKAWIDYLNAEADAQNAEADAFNAYKEQQESILNEANKKITDAQADAAQAQSEIDAAIANGIYADQSVYDRLAKAQQAEADGQRELAEGYRALAQNQRLAGSSGEYLKSAADAESSATTSEKSARETGYQTELNQITNLQNAYVDLQSSATKTENELDAADIKRQKTSERLYNNLISNGKEQIDNLKQQRQHYVNLKRAAEQAFDLENARNYQSEMDNIDSSIASMENNIISWSDTMTSLVSTNANELVSVLSSAMSEINSETGLTIDTMNELQRQFSDLAGYDVSSIFYQSADGMKMNVDAAEALVHAEYEVEQANLHEIISTNEKILADQNATQSAREQAEARIQAAQRELSMLQALYDQQKQQFSDFQQWQNAESTADAGDRYKTIQSAIKDMKEARKKGLTGTDEFRSFTKMIDEYGLDTVAAFDRSIANVERYFTEDASGLGKFFADAVAKGYGTGSAAEGYTLAIPDVDEFSDALDITREMTDILLGRAEDYGVYNDWVETVTDGELKLAEVMEQSADAQLKMNQLRREGASQDVIDNQQEVIDRLDNRKENIEAGIAALSERENYVTAEELRNGIADFKSLRHMLYNDEIDESTFKRRAQQLADDTHIKLTPDLMQVDESEMQKAFPDYNEVKVTPILAENANVLGVDETGEESFDNILGLLKSAYDETEGWDEEVGSILSSLEGYTGEDFDKIIFGDGTYQNQELESALDSLLAKLGLGQEQGEALVSVLKEVFGLNPEQKYSVSPQKRTEVVGDTFDNISQQNRAAAEEELSAEAQANIQAFREEAQRERDQGPTIKAITTGASDIVSAIASLPEGLATALSVNKKPETPGVLNTQERLTQSVANNYPSQSTSFDISKEKLQVAATTQVELSGVENIGNNLEPDQKIKITIPVDDVNADVSGANFDINKDNQQLPLIIDAANVSDNMVSDSLSSLSDMRRTIVEAQVQKERELMREALEQTSAESTSEIHDGVVDQIQHVADDIKESGEKIDIKIPLSNILLSFVDDSTITSDDGFGSMLSGQIQHMADGVTGSVPLENSGEAKEVQINYTGNQGEMNAVVSQDVASGQMTADGNPIEPQYESGNGLVNMVVDAITSASFVAEKNPIEINYTGGESATAESQAAPVVTPQVDNAEYDSAMSSAIESADELDSKKPTPKAGLDTGGFDSGASHVESKMSYIEGLTSTPTIDVNVSPAMSNLEALQQKAAQTAAALASVGSGGGGGTNKVVPQYTGTMLSPAHASGTAYNMLNMRNITDAFANGKVDLAHDEEALVNELGTESIVRDGKWFLIPGGMHVEALKKGDIVLNHLQTADLIQHGKAFGRGKAFAQGSGVNLADLRPVAPAHGGTNPYTTVETFTPWADDTIPKAAANAQNANTNATKANTAAKDKETDAVKQATSNLDKFNAWVSSLFDWIEVRIERITHRMELAISKAENIGGAGGYAQSTYKGKTGYAAKNAYIDDAMAQNVQLQSTNQRAIGIYEEQATKVARKAQKAGLITKNQRKTLVRRIKNGAMTIQEFDAELKKNKKGEETSKSESKRKTFVDAYKQWYDKARQAEAAVQDCIDKQKELQQTKLDNIVEQYESLANYAQAISASSQAMVSLHQASGFSESNDSVEGQQTRQQFANQIALERQVGDLYQDEMSAYAEEMRNALAIFGADSNEYRAAKTAYEGMNKAFIESKTNVQELTRSLYDLNLKPMEYALNRLQAAGQRFADIVSLKQARGTMKNDPSSVLTELNFTDQIQNANSQIAQLTQRMEYNRRIQEDLDYATDSAKWDELQKQIEADEHSIAQLTITNEQLKDSIRELRWKEFDDLQKKVTNAISDFDHLRGLFNEEEFFDDDGEGWNLTKEGKANIALLGAQIMETRNQIADYREALNKVNEEYDNGVISQEEYEEYSRNMVETIQKLVENTENYKDALIDLYKTQITNENEALQKNIKLRQDALSKQREYYEYSKKLTDQQKDRNKIVAQINALQGNANLSARAQVARLREQLAEAEEGLDSTRRDHRYDLLNEGYSKLSEDAQESLDKTLRHVAANAQQQEQIVEMMLSKVKGNYDEAYGVIQQRISDTGTVVSQTADQCLKDGPLQLFFENLDSKTITPKNNWDQFITATTQKIDTSAIDEFVTHLGEKLSDAKQIAKDTAQALADAAKQQSSDNNSQVQSGTNTNNNNNNNQNGDNNNSNTGLQQDKVVQILKSLKKGKSKTGGDVGDWIEKTFGLSTTSGIPTQLASALGISVSKKWAKGDSEKVLKALKAHLKKLKISDLKTLKAFKGYKRGTLGTLEDELAFTHEGEIIRRSDGAILRQLPAGTQVIPKVESENLLKWAQIDPFKELKEGFKGSNQITNTSNNAPVFYYDSVIHIDGNVDADMMDRVEQLGKALLSSGNFQKGVVQKVTQEYKREFNKRY